MSTQYISRNDTQAMKGVAILFMLFYHLFFLVEAAEFYTPLLSIHSVPLVCYLSRGMNPVAFFLILGGYGMYIVTQKGDKHRYSRILKLLIHYWVITLLFLLLGCWLQPDRYPGSLLEVIENLTTYRTTYNDAIWFLLPYLLITLSSPWLFRLSERIPTAIYLAGFLLLYLAMSYVSSRYLEWLIQDAHYWLYIVIRSLRLVFAFVLGGMAAKLGLFGQVATLRNRWLLAVCLCLVFGVRCCFSTSMFDVFYSFAMLFLLLQIRRSRILDATLTYLGNHSMNMWMIHNWIFLSLFTSFIYGFGYPLLCFAVLLGTSLLCSWLIDWICKPLTSRI